MIRLDVNDLSTPTAEQAPHGFAFFRGDLAICTGREVEGFDGYFVEAKMVQGHRAGDVVAVPVANVRHA